MAIFLLFLFICLASHGQNTPDTLRFRVMSYNVENLFDCRDDTLTADEEFLSEAPRHWTPRRYWQKLDHISRVIAAVGEWQMPALVALCEVENDSTLHDLTRRSPLRHAGYRYLMTHSADLRGMDVALLYRRDLFRPIASQSLHIPPCHDQHRPTRDILLVSGELPNRDTLDIFVLHFPSKLQGAKQTLPYRMQAARTLKQAADSLHALRRRPQILMLGDFNDTPDSPVLRHLLQDSLYSHLLPPSALPRQTPGSYAYQGRWQLIDHLIASTTLLRPDVPCRWLQSSVYAAPFLLTADRTHGGWRPLRTYHAYRYEGGYSDHLPLWAEFLLLY